jgi:hypothetical protein
LAEVESGVRLLQTTTEKRALADFANTLTLCTLLRFCFPATRTTLHAVFCFPAARSARLWPDLVTLCTPTSRKRPGNADFARRAPDLVTLCMPTLRVDLVTLCTPTETLRAASHFPSTSPPSASPGSASPAKPSQVPNKIQLSRIWLWSSWSGLQEGIGCSSREEYQQNEGKNKIREERANQDKI